MSYLLDLLLPPLPPRGGSGGGGGNRSESCSETLSERESRKMFSSGSGGAVEGNNTYSVATVAWIQRHEVNATPYYN